MGGRRTSGRCAAALALCAPLVAAPAAHAGGGSTIAGAPVAAPGISYTGIARAGERYWRVDLGVGNGLDVSGVVNDPHGASVCVLSPLATDATPATPLACQAPAPDATTFSFHFGYVSTRDG